MFLVMLGRGILAMGAVAIAIHLAADQVYRLQVVMIKLRRMGRFLR